MANSVWHKCRDRLEHELTSDQFNTWIRPLQARQADGGITLLAPNRYVKDHVESLFLRRIGEMLDQEGDPANPLDVALDIGSEAPAGIPLRVDGRASGLGDYLNRAFTFETFV